MPGPSDGQEGRRQLELLQEELQALKGSWGRALRLQRATPAEAPATAPFPIALTFQVDPPSAAAAHYDVSAVRIQIRLSRAALQLAHKGSTAGAAASGSGGGSSGAAAHGLPPQPSLPAGTGVSVLSDELPRLLRNRMEQELTRAWLEALAGPAEAGQARGGTSGLAGGGAAAAGAPQSGQYRLSAAASYMQECFVPLISLVPELVEPYQAEDEHGATVRRYAIVNNDGDAAGGSGDAGGTAEARGEAGPGGEAGGVPEPEVSAAGGAGDGGCRAPSPAGPHTQTRGSVQPVAQRTAPGPGSPQPLPGPGTSPQGTGVAAARPAPADCGGGGGGSTAPSGPAPTRAGPPDIGPADTTTTEAMAPGRSSTADSTFRSPDAAISDPRPSSPPAPPPPPSPSPSPSQSPSQSPSSLPPPPPGLLSYNIAVKELQYIQKRYSQVFSARVHRDGPGPAGGGGGGAHSSIHLLQPGCLTTFELELLPTDPDWDMPAVRLVGQLMPVSDSAYLPSLGVALASRLPQWLRAALETHMAQRLAAAAAEADAAAAAAAAAAATAATQTDATERAVGAVEEQTAVHGAGCGARVSGRGAAGGVGGGRRLGGGAGRGGRVGGAARQEAEAAPDGTVLLPLGALRNLFRDLENYAGAVARAADEERRQRERDAAAAGRDDVSSGSEFDGSGDEASRFDDDGYGDGSHRRGGGAAAPAGSDEYESDGDESDDSSDGVNDHDGTAADEVRFSGAAAAAEAGSEAPAAYAVLLEGLQLDNLAAVEVLRANFEVSCARCGARDVVAVASAAVAGGGGGSSASHQAAASGHCQRCTAPWSLVMRPHFVHATSNSLCVIKPEGIRPVDLLPSLMAGQCGECSAVMSLREVQVGLPFSRNCSSCHKELSLSVAAVSFVPRGPPRAGTGGGSAAGRGAARGAGSRRTRADAGGGSGGGAGGLRPGQPLPALGTCKHYRHSYRWLRFPCCGMRFPCDLCHEEAVSDGHPVRWAQRMVCGFCSTEQHLALACRACGRQLAGSAANPSGRRTRFWEGGTGCRDLRRLNRNDPHKWRGRNKTVSAKQSRVGPKPWSGKAGGGGGAGSGSG